MGTYSFAQNLTGTIYFRKDSTVAPACRIILNEGKPSTITDEKGFFSFKKLPKGTYQVLTTLANFQSVKQQVKIDNQNI